MKKRTSNLITLFLIFILLAGLSLLLYPTVSDYWNSLHQSHAIASYAEQVAEIDSDTYEQLWADAQAYNQSLIDKADRYDMTDEERAQYESLLNVSGNGIIGYIEIPSINCSLPIYHGTDEAILQIAVGHIEGTSLPVGGSGTHCVLSGHRGLPSARLFTDLDKMVIGDTFLMRVLDETLTYEVDQIRIVLPYELDDLEIEEGKDYCTLVTCTPYGINSHRLLVRGHRIENQEEAQAIRITADAMQIEPLLVAPIVAIPMLLILLVILLLPKNQRKKPEVTLMKMNKRLISICLSLLLVFMLLPVSALAAGRIDLDQDVGLTITYQNHGTPLSGAVFNIYLVATVNAYGELETTEQFKIFNVDIPGKADDTWRALASTLEGYVLRDNIAATDSGKTDRNGQIAFPTGGKRLTAGLYLVLGERHTQDGYRYDATPFMVMLPSLDKENNVWSYDVAVSPKFDRSKIPGSSGDDTITRKVLKVWEDKGQEKDRPEEVIVQLLRDGKVFDTVTLNAANNWRYTWTALDNGYSWTVVEKETDNYTVEVTQEGITFVVKNTHNEDIPDEPTTPTKPTLPQTGQLWWPVPVLIAAGLLFVVIGLLRCRGAADEK